MAFPNGWTDRVKFSLPGGRQDVTWLFGSDSLDIPEVVAASLADGADLRCTDEDNNSLPVHIIRFVNDAANIVCRIAVRYPGLTTSQSEIRFWFGDATATLPAADSEYGQYNAYGFDFLAFYPQGLGSDATRHQLHLTAAGSPTVGGVAGPVAGSLGTDLNGTSQYGVVTMPEALVAPFRVRAQTKIDVDTLDLFAVGLNNPTTTQNYFALQMLGTQNDEVAWVARNTSSQLTGVGDFTPGEWNQSAGFEESSGSRYSYFNSTTGTQNTVLAIPSNITQLVVGARGGTSFASFFNGSISEVAIIQGVGDGRDNADNWEMVYDQEALYGSGIHEAVELGEPPILTDENPPTLIGSTAIGSTVVVDDGGWDGGSTNLRQIQLADDDGGEPADEYSDISGATGTSFELTFADVEVDQWIRVKVRRANENGSTVAYSIWYQVTAVVASTVGSFPAFERVKRLVTTAQVPWLAGTNVGPYYFRPVDLDWLRLQPGMDLDATFDDYRWLAFISTDHAVGTGKVGGVLFNDIEGDLTILETAFFTGSNQRETPYPVYDPDGERLLVYCHDNNSNGAAYNQQHQIVMQTTDCLAYSLLDANPLNYANHTGYPQVTYNEDHGEFENYHLMTGGEYFFHGISTATDPTEFTLAELQQSNLSHIFGPAKCMTAAPFLFEYEGDPYVISMLETRQASQLNGTAIIALPCFKLHGRAPRFKGGYFILAPKGTSSGDADYQLTGGDPWVGYIGDTLYMVQSARDGFFNQALVLYRATETEATYTAPYVSINGNGRMRNPPKRTLAFEWDAANDSVPAEIDISLQSGTNNSSQSAGNYYELKTGSGSNQQITLGLDGELFDPTEHDSLEIVVEDVVFNPTPSGSSSNNSLHQHLFGLLNFKTNVAGSWADQDGFILFTSNSHAGGSYRSLVNNGIVSGSSQNTFAWGTNYGTVTIADYLRQLGDSLTFKFADFGTKLFILRTQAGYSPLTDGQIVWWRDLTNDEIPWGDSMFTIRVQTLTSTWPQTWLRFSGIKVYTLNASEVFTAGTRSRLMEPSLIG